MFRFLFKRDMCELGYLKCLAGTVLDLQEEGRLEISSIKCDNRPGTTGALLDSPLLVMNCD